VAAHFPVDREGDGVGAEGAGFGTDRDVGVLECGEGMAGDADTARRGDLPLDFVGVVMGGVVFGGGDAEGGVVVFAQGGLGDGEGEGLESWGWCGCRSG